MVMTKTPLNTYECVVCGKLSDWYSSHAMWDDVSKGRNYTCGRVCRKYSGMVLTWCIKGHSLNRKAYNEYAKSHKTIMYKGRRRKITYELWVWSQEHRLSMRCLMQ